MDTPAGLSTKIEESAGHIHTKFPLHDAVKREDYKTISSFLLPGLKPEDVNIKNSDGKTVIDLAGELNTEKGRILFTYLQTIRDLQMYNIDRSELTKVLSAVSEGSTSARSSREMDEEGVYENENINSALRWKYLEPISETDSEPGADPLIVLDKDEKGRVLQKLNLPDDNPETSTCGSMRPSRSSTTFPKQLEQGAGNAYRTAAAKRRLQAKRDFKTKQLALASVTKGTAVRLKNELSTALHDAVEQGNANWVRYFLHKGADINSRNINGQTVLEAARKLNTNEGREIVKVLEARYRKQTHLTNVVALHKSYLNTNFKQILPLKNENKEQGKSTRKELYLTKLSSLVFFRASTSEVKNTFLLGANINDIKAFKGLCIRYQQKKEDVVIFLQAIHNYDRGVEKISPKELWATDGDLSLIKFYNSYIKIRHKFDENNNTDLIFDGRYENLKCYFILYTTLKDDFGERKCIIDDKLETNETVKDLLSTIDDNANIFQYKHDELDIDCLTNTFIKERFGSIAKSLLDLAGTDHINKNMDYNIRTHHLLLAKKVIEIANSNIGKFRSEFLTSNDQALLLLRGALYRQAVREKLQKDKINEAIRLILIEPNAHTISKLIGNVIVYNNQSKKLEVARYVVELVEPRLRESLSELQVSRTTAKRAMVTAGTEKLKKLRFMLPEGFGKFTFNIKGANVKKSYNQFAAKLEVIINGSTSKNIPIDENVVGPNKILEPGDMDINSCIGTALTDLLVLDEDSKSFRFNMNEDTLEPNARRMLDELRSRIEDLDTYRLQVNLPGYPKLSFDAGESEKVLAKDFLNNLWFFTAQADEGDMDKIVVKEIFDRIVSLPKNV